MTTWCESNPRPFLRLADMVRRRGKVQGARRRLSLSGITVAYDKLWFPSVANSDQYALEGRGWHLLITVSPKADTTIEEQTLSSRLDHSRVTILIRNRDRMERDITLLRMFGIEELFSR